MNTIHAHGDDLSGLSSLSGLNLDHLMVHMHRLPVHRDVGRPVVGGPVMVVGPVASIEAVVVRSVSLMLLVTAFSLLKLAGLEL